MAGRYYAAEAAHCQRDFLSFNSVRINIKYRMEKYMDQWMIYAKKADFNGIAAKYHISPVTARIIRNRDVTGDEEIRQYLYGSKEDLNPPLLMKDMGKARDLILSKIEQNRKIRVVGDYDADGVNSTYILVMGLSALGASVDFAIPDRIRDGYGINIDIISRALEDGTDTIITCDNGISAAEQVAFARANGMAVIITDHHDIPPAGPPEADAVVNPKQADCGYPFKGLCGAAVAYKLIQAIYEKAGKPREQYEKFLEFAALATVADVMELKGENRIIVREGLKLLRNTANPGLNHLMEETQIHKENLKSYHLGFIIGPCLNAGGRLDTARLALSLLMSGSEEEAASIAAELKALNDTRKDMTLSGVKQACAMIEETELKDDKVLVVYLPDCHESIAGIIAGRIKEIYHKPSIVLTRALEGAKGSARSIEAYHMYEGLVGCSDLLSKFGGHPMAAGLSLPIQNIGAFRTRINEQAELTEKDFIKKVWIDTELPFAYVNEKLIGELAELEPFGNGNEKPLFAARGLHVRRLSVLGKNRNVVKMTLSDTSQTSMSAVWFGDGDEFVENIKNKYGESAADMALHGLENPIVMSATYYPGINDYMGNRTVQITIQDCRFH